MGRNRHGNLPRKSLSILVVDMPGFDTTVRKSGLAKTAQPEAQQKYDLLIHEFVSNRLQLSPPPVDTPATQEQPEPKPAADDIRGEDGHA
jgi:hypothetical protein